MPVPDCDQTTVNLMLTAFIAAMATIKFVIDYFRHDHVKSDNQRLLHVIEGKTERPGEVK